MIRTVRSFMAYILGVSGGVGCGKSAVLDYLEEHADARIIKSDECTHEMMLPGAPAYGPLVRLLEEEGKREDSAPLLDSEGVIDRREMAARIFGNDSLRQKVNSILHPAVMEYLSEEAEKERNSSIHEFFVVEAALLIENRFGETADEMWYIYCDEKERRRRLKESRGYSDEKIDSIMAAQLSEEEFRAGTDVTIDNSGSIEDTRSQVERELFRIRKGGGKRRGSGEFL